MPDYQQEINDIKNAIEEILRDPKKIGTKAQLYEALIEPGSKIAEIVKYFDVPIWNEWDEKIQKDAARYMGHARVPDDHFVSYTEGNRDIYTIFKDLLLLQVNEEDIKKMAVQLNTEMAKTPQLPDTPQPLLSEKIASILRHKFLEILKEDRPVQFINPRLYKEGEIEWQQIIRSEYMERKIVGKGGKVTFQATRNFFEGDKIVKLLLPGGQEIMASVVIKPKKNINRINQFTFELKVLGTRKTDINIPNFEISDNTEFSVFVQNNEYPVLFNKELNGISLVKKYKRNGKIKTKVIIQEPSEIEKSSIASVSLPEEETNPIVRLTIKPAKWKQILSTLSSVIPAITSTLRSTVITPVISALTSTATQKAMSEKIPEARYFSIKDTLQKMIPIIEQETGKITTAYAVYEFQQDGSTLDYSKPNTPNNLLNTIHTDLDLTPLEIFKKCLKAKIVEVLFDPRPNKETLNFFLKTILEHPDSLERSKLHRLDRLALKSLIKHHHLDMYHMKSMISPEFSNLIFHFKKEILSNINTLDAIQYVNAFMVNISEENILKADKTYFKKIKTQIINDLLDKMMMERPPFRLEIIAVESLTGRYLSITRPLNINDIGRNVLVTLPNIKCYAQVYPVYDPNDPKKITTFGLKVSGMSNVRNDQLSGYGNAQFQFLSFKNTAAISYPVSVKTNHFIPSDVNANVNHSQPRPLALNSNFQIDFTDEIITSSLKAELVKIDNDNNEIAPFRATVRILTELTSTQIHHLKSQYILQNHILVFPPHVQQNQANAQRGIYVPVVYVVTNKEKKGESREEIIGDFQEPPAQHGAGLRDRIVSNLLLKMDVHSVLEKMKIEFFKGRSPHLKFGPETLKGSDVGNVILKIDSTWPSTEMAQEMADMNIANVVLMNLTNEGVLEVFGNENILKRRLNWWVVGEIENHLVAGYSPKELAKAISGVTLKLQERSELKELNKNLVHISVISPGIENTTSFNNELISSLHEWGIFARLPDQLPQPSIEQRLSVFELLEKLHSKQLSFDDLSPEQWQDLGYFFRNWQGTFHTQKLISHITNPEILNSFGADILRLGGINSPFLDSQVPGVMTKMPEIQKSGVVALQNLSNIHDGSFERLPQNLYRPQGPEALSTAKTLIFAYQQNPDNFFALFRQMESLEHQRQRGVIQPSDLNALQEFHDRFDQLQSSVKEHVADVDAPSSLSSLLAEPGDYLLHSGKGALMVSLKEAGEKWRYTLYDPNVGELTIKIHKNVEDPVRILGSVLADYLNQNTSGTQTIGEYYGFEKENGVYKISMSRMKPPVTGVPVDTVHTVDELGLRMKAFHELPFSFIEHTDTNQLPFSFRKRTRTHSRHERTSPGSSVHARPFSDPSGSLESRLSIRPMTEDTIDPPQNTVPGASQSELKRIKQEKLRSLHRRLGPSLIMIKTASTLDATIHFIKYFMLQGKKKDKTPEEAEMENYQNLQAMNLTVNLVIDGAQYTFYRRMRHSKEIQKGVQAFNTLMSHATKIKLQVDSVKGVQIFKTLTGHAADMMSHATKMKGLAGAVGVNALNFVGVVFDIYMAYDAFDKASREQDPDRKMDWMVQGIFQSVQVASGTVISTMAVVSVVSPGASVAVGVLTGGALVLSLAMLLAARIYSAISQVKEISKEIELSLSEKIKEAIHISILDAPTPETENRLSKKRTRDLLEQKYDKQSTERAQNIFGLLQNINVNHYFYVKDTFTLEGKPYIELTYHTNEGVKGIVPPFYSYDMQGNLLKDLFKNLVSHWNKPGYFRKEDLKERKETFTEIINNMKLNPGEGVQVTGYEEKESEYQYYEPVLLTESDDVVNANLSSQDSSFVKQLEIASFPDWPVVNPLHHFTELHGTDKNDLLILPKNQSGAINAHGGDDTLVLQDGHAMGGTGTDTYCIFPGVIKGNRPYHRFTVDIDDEPGEFSYIMLNYYLCQIEEIRLLRDGGSFYLTLLLWNPDNSKTLLKIKDLYCFDKKNQDELVLNRRFTLITDDGLLLAPRLPAFMNNPLKQNESVLLRVEFDALYCVDYDQESYYNPKPALINSANHTLTKTLNNGNTVTHLPDYIHFIKDHPVSKQELQEHFSPFLTPIKDNVAVFDLGGGNDTGTGYLNQKNHFLPGKGKKKYEGGDCDDIFNLECGKVKGLKGLDSYHILNNSQAQDVEVLITEESHEISNIHLQHKLINIESIRLDANNALKMRLKNINGTHTTVILESLYRRKEPESTELVLDKNVIFYTQDGAMMTPQWAERLTPKDGFEGICHVQYHYLNDLHHQQYFKETPADQVKIRFKKGSGQSPDSIRVGEDEIFLTEHQALILSDTPFNDEMEGNEAGNIFLSYRGNDLLRGKKGADIYEMHLDNKNQARTVWIDNTDHAPEPETDEITLPLKINQLHQPLRRGDDIVISTKEQRDSKPALEIILLNFMKGEKYRHIKIRDASNELYELGVDADGVPYLGQPKEKITPTEGNDIILLTEAQASPVMFSAGGGDDIIVDKSTVIRHIKGGLGNDHLLNASPVGKMLEGEQGHNELYGSDGNDIFVLGRGIDQVQGGEGDDVYDYTYRAADDEEHPADHDVRVTIEDIEGENQLNLNQVALKDIKKDQSRNSKDICLIISKDAEPKKQDRLIIKDVNKSIKKVVIEGHHMSMAELIQRCSTFRREEVEAQSAVNVVSNVVSDPTNPMLPGNFVAS